jgi:hypothetical protein
MIELLLAVYFLVSLILVVAAMVKYPPRSGRQREAEEWIIGIGLCWLIWPVSLLDLLAPKGRGRG